MQESEEARGWGLHASSCKTVVGCHSVLQSRRWMPFIARSTYRSPDLGRSMAGCDGFAKGGRRKALQKRPSPPSVLANPALPAARFCRTVVGRHKLLQTRPSPPSRFAEPSQPAIFGEVFGDAFSSREIWQMRYTVNQCLRVSPSGKARASQARIRGFESRHPLH